MNFNLPIILASTSPRRHELLNQCQITHEILKTDIDESILPNESAIDYIQRMVVQKSEQAVKTCHKANYLLITADTIGVLSTGEILLKPTNFDNAKHMWQKMSDNTHEVWTAINVSLIKNRQIISSNVKTVKTCVHFVKLTDTAMLHYWQTGEPQDKAGAYAIQGIGAKWVKKIDGSYSNVVGLPLVETIALLEKLDKIFV